MTARRVLLLLLTILIPALSLSQPPDSLWSRTYGGSSYEKCSSAQQTADGGYVLTGDTYTLASGSDDFWLVKIDANGDSLWCKAFGGTDWEGCNSVQQTTDGGYILAGYTQSFGAGYCDFWLVKTDADGDSLWSRTFGGSYNEECRSVQQTSDGGYILAGHTQSFTAGEEGIWLVKTNINGDSLWSRVYCLSDGDRCYSIQQTANGGYVLGGMICNLDTGLWDYLLVKTDSNGDSLWSRTYGGPDADHCFTVKQTFDGGYVLAGYTSSFGAENHDIWLVKTDANGDSLWSRTYGGINRDECRSVQQTADGGYILGGHTYDLETSNWDFWLVRVDVNGEFLWDRTYGGAENDFCYTVLQTSDSGYALAGGTFSFGAGDYDFWFIKTGPEGTPVWERRIPAPQQFTLSVYPNPFNPTTTITFDLPKAMNAQLRIFDITGRTVTTLADEHFTTGTHQVTFDGSTYSSGVYFARLQTDNHQQTEKLILLK